MPDEVTLRITRPMIRPELDDARFAEYMTRLVEAHEDSLAREHARAGRPFLGADAVRAQRPYDRPKTVEPRRKLSPRVAAKDETVRIAALQRIVEFVQRYRQAYTRWREGVRNIPWPVGTYAMRVVHKVELASDSG